MTDLEIPTVDLKNIFVDKTELQNLHEGLVNVGFIYVKNHGISTRLISKIRKISKEFFHSTLETRKRLESYKGILIHDGSAFSMPVFEGP